MATLQRNIRSARTSTMLLAALGLLLTSNALWIAYCEIRSYRNTHTLNEISVFVDQNYRLSRMRVRIEIALIIGTVAAWMWRKQSTRATGLVSVFAWLWVTGEYVRWYIWSLSAKENIGLGHLPEPSAANFYGALWWDLVILLISIIALCWVLRVSFRRHNIKQLRRSEQTSR